MGSVQCDAWQVPSDIHKEVLSEYPETWAYKYITHRITSYGRHMWVVVENRETGERLIQLTTILGRPHSYDGLVRRDENEQMGPCEYDCPLELLDIAQPMECLPSNFSEAWREKVRAYHKRLSRTFAPGDVVSVYGKEFRILGQVKRSYRAESVATGDVYLIRPSQIT